MPACNEGADGGVMYEYPGLRTTTRIKKAWLTGGEASRQDGLVEFNRVCLSRAPSDFLGEGTSSGRGVRTRTVLGREE